MKLAIDIGNTSISVGVFDKYQLIQRSNFSNIDEFIKFVLSVKNYNIKCAIISSVVPVLTKKYKQLLENKYQYNVIVINYKLSQLTLNVEQPETVGADRVCNIYAIQKDYQTPAIIIDFGTATTYDVINQSGAFIGGVIAAGIETSAQYLIEKAALLSTTKLEFPNKVIGKNTRTNIQSGIMFGAIDQVEGMIQRIKKETNTHYNIILTGGFSALISPQLSFKHIVDSDLTLKGIIYIHESN